MPVLTFPQFEHEPFLSYLSRFNDYRAQLNQNFQKWKICEVIAISLNSESLGYIEFTYPRGVLEFCFYFFRVFSFCVLFEDEQNLDVGGFV